MSVWGGSGADKNEGEEGPSPPPPKKKDQSEGGRG